VAGDETPVMPGRPGESGVFDEGTRAEKRRAAHFDRTRRPRIADLSETLSTLHQAEAEAEVEMSQETLSAIIDGAVAKGDVLSVAELAGVMAGKRTADLIPLVHPATLTHLLVNASPDRAAGAVRIRTEAAAVGPAGVEVEALTAASVAALTVYDMIRDLEPGAAVRMVRLISSSDGSDGEWRRGGDGLESPRPARSVRTAGRIVANPPGNRPPLGSPSRRHGR
jgi:cyclic pyranopterin phosphate synthase